MSLTRRLCTLDAPVDGAAWIPLAELPARLHELPPKHVPLHLIGPGREFLAGGGRTLTDDAGLPGDRLWSPNPLVEAWTGPPGFAIDLGCGSGREAVWLARAGWQVLAIDRLPDAVERGQDLASRWGVADRIEWRVERLVTVPPGADLHLMLRWLDRSLLPKSGGFLGEFFSDVHRASFAKPKDAPSESEVRAWFPDARVEASWREDGVHTVRVERPFAE